MKFESIVEYLEQQIPELKRGENLFINQMPSSVEEGYVLKQSFSGTEIDGYMPGLRRGRFQLAGRGASYAGVKKVMEDISSVLTMQGKTLSDIEVKMMRPLNEPLGFMRSDGDNVEFSVNFRAIYGIVNC